jgi:2-haloacid dehalogenase
MNEIRHIVFDLGRVLVRWEADIPYRRLIPDDRRRRRFLDEICNATWLLETDRGMSWEEAENRLIARYPEEAEMIRAFREHWPERLPGAIDDSVAVAEGLIDRGVDVTALTNWAADTFPIAEARFPVFGRMRGITVSARVGLVKPDPAIFHLHAKTFALDPKATLFFDDNPHNVEAARGVGWNAEVFTGADRMRADLQRHGVVL